MGNDVVDDRALYLISLIQEVFINNDRALKLNSLLDLMLLDFPDIWTLQRLPPSQSTQRRWRRPSSPSGLAPLQAPLA